MLSGSAKHAEGEFLSALLDLRGTLNQNPTVTMDIDSNAVGITTNAVAHIAFVGAPLICDVETGTKSKRAEIIRSNNSNL